MIIYPVGRKYQKSQAQGMRSKSGVTMKRARHRYNHRLAFPPSGNALHSPVPRYWECFFPCRGCGGFGSKGPGALAMLVRRVAPGRLWGGRAAGATHGRRRGTGARCLKGTRDVSVSLGVFRCFSVCFGAFRCSEWQKRNTENTDLRVGFLQGRSH